MRVWLCGAAALVLMAAGGARAEAPLATDTPMKTAAGKPVLVIRDGQHAYVYNQAA